MVRGGDRHNVTGERVDLEQQRTNHALDLPGFVEVTALLPDGIKFIKEEDALAGSGVLKQMRDSLCGLPKVASDDGLVSYEKQGNVKPALFTSGLEAR